MWFYWFTMRSESKRWYGACNETVGGKLYMGSKLCWWVRKLRRGPLKGRKIRSNEVVTAWFIFNLRNNKEKDTHNLIKEKQFVFRENVKRNLIKTKANWHFCLIKEKESDKGEIRGRRGRWWNVSISLQKYKRNQILFSHFRFVSF